MIAALGHVAEIVELPGWRDGNARSVFNHHPIQRHH